MRWALCSIILAALAGCRAISLDIDGQIAQRATAPVDLAPAEMDTLPPPRKENTGDSRVKADSVRPATFAVTAEQNQPVPNKKPTSMLDRIMLSPEVPGANAPEIRLPSLTAPRAEMAAAINKLFPPLPAIPNLPEARPAPNGTPLSLTDLQQMAMQTSPLIRQAHLNVEAARGSALQAGLYPNPVLGYESSAIGQGQTPGQQGGFIEQTIKTNGKLQLARAAALAEIQITEQRLKQAESDLRTRVRMGYFAVLSARTNFDAIKALTRSTDILYTVLLEQLGAGEVAPYEPMQIRVLALQSRSQLVLAHNRYLSAWKQLAATLGEPTLPLTALQGRIDIPVPHFEYAAVMDYVLNNHTEILNARLGTDKAGFHARLAEAQPFPDVTVHAVFQKDYTQAPYGSVANVTVGVPFPLWDRNQGNIQNARAQLRFALEDVQRVRNDLASKVADAFERYQNNRALLELYKTQILPNQVQAFRAAVARHAVVGDQRVPYSDVVTAQQTLASMINNYLAALNDQWTAVVDIANLLQTRDLFQIHCVEEVAPIPDVPEILQEELKHKR